MSDDLLRRIERLERAVFQQDRPVPYEIPQVVRTSECPVCHIKWTGAMGYACINNQCPYMARST